MSSREEPQQPTSSDPNPPPSNRPPRHQRPPSNRSSQNRQMPNRHHPNRPPLNRPPLNRPPPNHLPLNRPNRPNLMLGFAESDAPPAAAEAPKFGEAPRNPPEAVNPRPRVVPSPPVYAEYQYQYSEYRGPWPPVFGIAIPLFCPVCHVSCDYMNRCLNLSCHNYGQYTATNPARDGRYPYGRYPVFHIIRVYSAFPEDAPYGYYEYVNSDAQNQ